MRVVINEALVKRYRTVSQVLFLVSLAGMGVGFFYTWTQPETSSQLSCMILPILFLMTLSSVRLANNWIREPRPVNVLSDALKGLGQKYTLLHYLMPAHHVLIGPEGIFAIHTVWQERPYRVNGSKWYGDEGIFHKINGYMRQDLLGNPFTEAQFAAQQTQKVLKRLAPDTEFEVRPLVVFIGANANVEIEDPIFPVLYADAKRSPSLRDYLRDLKEGEYGTLTEKDLDAIDRAYNLMTREEIAAIESGEYLFDGMTGNYYAAADFEADQIAASAADSSDDDHDAELDADDEAATGTVLVVQGGQLYYIGSTENSVEDELPRLQEESNQDIELLLTIESAHAARLADQFQKKFQRKEQKKNWYGLSQKDVKWLKAQRDRN